MRSSLRRAPDKSSGTTHPWTSSLTTFVSKLVAATSYVSSRGHETPTPSLPTPGISPGSSAWYRRTTPSPGRGCSANGHQDLLCGRGRLHPAGHLTCSGLDGTDLPLHAWWADT